MALRTSTELPTYWTPTDQRIMEHLLLDEAAEQQKATGSPRTVELQAAEKQDKFMTRSGKLQDKKQAKQVEEDRRARHRAVQRRFIQRKKAAMERTKELSRTLEHKYRYLEGAVEVRNLKAENRELQEKVESAGMAVASTPSVDHVQLLMQNQMELVHEFYEPITPDVWTRVQHHAQHEYELSRRDDSFLTSGASIMGWNDFRKVDESSVKFVLSKGFQNARALHLMNFTWQKVSTPSTYASFFSPAIPIKMQILQVISHDAIVIHRVLFNPQTQSSSNSLELMWRVRLGEEYVIFDSALQHNAVQQCLGASYKWTQMTTSLGFASLDAHRDTGCLFRHGGWIRTLVTNVDYWFMEMFFMALRFESTMVAPVFSLPAEQPSDQEIHLVTF